MRLGVVSATAGDLEPDLVAVERLARLRLLADRVGLRLEIRQVSPELRSLLAFLGLEDVILADPPLGWPPDGQPSSRNGSPKFGNQPSASR